MPSFVPALPDHLAVVRLSAMGDVALTTGILLHWRETRGLSFSVLTKAAFAPLFAHHPAVREVIPLDPDDLHGVRQRRLFRSLAADLAGVPLVDLHGTLRTRLLGRVWRGPVYRYPKHALARRVFLASHGRLCRARLLRHNVPQRYWQALPLSGEAPGETPAAVALRPRLFPTAAELAEAEARLAPLRRTPGAPLVALHPFATHPAKTWPLDVWLQFAALLDARGIAFFWVGRGAALSSLSQQETARNLTNRTDLRQLIALLARADALVTGDSGPMHLASGVDTPVAALFGPTCREWGFFPAGPRDIVLQRELPCRPCSLHGKTGPAGICSRHLACMAGLTPEKTLEALTGLLRPLSSGNP